MLLHTALLAVYGTFAVVSALRIFHVGEIDTTMEGSRLPLVAAPVPAGRFRQATRASIVARQQRRPAKRQASAVPICSRPVTGSTPYAVFTDSFFYTDQALGPAFTANQQDCYAYCEGTAGCVAVTWIDGGELYSSCRPLSGLVGISNRPGGEAQAEAKNMTCAQVKAMYTYAANYACCDALRT